MWGKRAKWNELSGMWGKRGWNDMSGGWGKCSNLKKFTKKCFILFNCMENSDQILFYDPIFNIIIRSPKIS
jgi:hypothetical protein